MDYEKKYKEIVGKIRKAYLYAQTDSTKAVLEEIFPELRESEDERIRNELIGFIKKRDRSGCDYDYDKWIAWLEKQGEQNLANSAKTCKNEQKHAWSEEDEKMRTSCVACIGYHYHDGLMTRKEYEHIRDWLYSLKDRYTWKPSDEQMIALRQVISGCSYDIEPLLELETKLKEF